MESKKIIYYLTWVLIVMAAWQVFGGALGILAELFFRFVLKTSMTRSLPTGTSHFIFNLIISIVLGIYLLIGALDAKKYKEKGRKLVVQMLIIMLIFSVIGMVYSSNVLVQAGFSTFLTALAFTFMSNVLYLAFYIFTIYYFSKPNIKKFFK